MLATYPSSRQSYIDWLRIIYFQMDEDVAAAKKTVEHFSALLRYQLYDAQKNSGER